MSSLAGAAEAKIFDELSSHVHSESAKSVFAVGGTILITNLDNRLICESDEAYSDAQDFRIIDSASKTSESAIVFDFATGKEVIEIPDDEKPTSAVHGMRCNPVTIRWDSDGNTGCKVTLPCGDAARPNFEQLLRDCQPATFGRGGEDVMDETYRKAGKLDESAFCSNFNPYALGIIDTVAQTLTPNICEQTNETHGLRAEQYKLNVYSGPSGKFKAHVDTPRSKYQVASLVICLPNDHQGGQLLLRHQGREQIFDWSGEKSRNAIQWAAFYSDCEHEVLQVTDGHRVTLTYSLYATCWANTAFIDPQQVELYQTLKRLLEEPAFCKKGLTLGYHCGHAYPHTEQSAIKTLPATLKGADKLVYECFFATKLNVGLRQMLDLGYDDHDDLISGILGVNADSDSDEQGEPPENLEDAFEQIEKENWQGEKIKVWKRKAEHKRQGDFAVMADRLLPLRFTNAGMNDGLSHREVAKEWAEDFKIECVKWLNAPIHQQPALLHGASGNQASTDMKYSRLVITIDIPPFHAR